MEEPEIKRVNIFLGLGFGSDTAPTVITDRFNGRAGRMSGHCFDHITCNVTPGETNVLGEGTFAKGVDLIVEKGKALDFAARSIHAMFSGDLVLMRDGSLTPFYKTDKWGNPACLPMEEELKLRLLSLGFKGNIVIPKINVLRALSPSKAKSYYIGLVENMAHGSDTKSHMIRCGERELANNKVRFSMGVDKNQWAAVVGLNGGKRVISDWEDGKIVYGAAPRYVEQYGMVSSVGFLRLYVGEKSMWFKDILVDQSKFAIFPVCI